MKSIIAKGIQDDFGSLYIQIKQFDKLFNNEKFSNEIDEMHNTYKDTLYKILINKNAVEEKNMENLVDKTLIMTEESDESFFKDSPKKPAYGTLKKNPLRFKVHKIFYYKPEIMDMYIIDDEEFYYHIKYPDTLWTVKISNNNEMILCFPSSNGYLYIDRCYSFPPYVSNPYIKNALLEKYKIGSVYQCWKYPTVR